MGKQPGRLELVTPQDLPMSVLKELKVDQILGFDKDGERQYWRVAKIYKKRKQWWLQPWRVYTDEEFRALERLRVG